MFKVKVVKVCVFYQNFIAGLKMRFVQVGSDSAQLCREFVLAQDVDISTIISFDCLWGNGVNAGVNYKFQYMITTEDGLQLLSTYLLKIPKDVNTIKGKYKLYWKHLVLLLPGTILLKDSNSKVQYLINKGEING